MSRFLPPGPINDPTLPDISPHKWAICAMCGLMVKCGYCGNNCCNASTGRVMWGVDCDCDEAYDLQDQWSKESYEWHQRHKDKLPRFHEMAPLIDERYKRLKAGLSQLTDEQLQRIIDTPEERLVCDTHLYHEGRW